MDNITIKIYLSSEGDSYMYDIYDTDEPEEDTESIDGGECTGTMLDALGMATAQAEAFIKANNK